MTEKGKKDGLLPDSELSHYRILKKIGAGGMGEVYLAEDTKLDRRVALKILPLEFAENADRMSRFVREAKAASALNHPNIITIYEINEFENIHFIATEFIDGKTLSEYAKDDPLNLKSVLEMAMQIASALQTAHSAGIVHRDIKPENIMIRQDGLVKILDFGIAKLSEKQHLEIESEDATALQLPATSPGVIIGTANYMSPEQAVGKNIDARSDIFSFGVLLYEMITGHLPFAGDTPMEIISAIIKDQPKPLDEDVPNKIAEIINRCLRKDRTERYQTIREVLNDLKDAKQELEFQDKSEKNIQPGESEPQTRMLKATTAGELDQTATAETRRDSITIKKSSFNKFAVGALAILIIAAIGLGYWLYAGKNTKQIESIAVMPFVNESNNQDVEYLSDGMTETLIGSLTEIPKLSVKARSTVFYYKGKEKSVKEIGQELNVEAVLLGRVSQRGDGLTLNLELVNAETLDAIWSETYNRKMSDLISLQSEIARNVSDKLRLKLTTEEQKQIAKTYTVNPEAQQNYLQGRFHWNKRNTADFQKAKDYFQKAIELDPNYSLAYSGLADTYSLMTFYGNFRPKEYMPLARQAAQKAIEIDPNSAEAHASLGQILQYEYDWTGSERELRKAVELNPKYPTARQWLAETLNGEGKFDEALTEVNKALELDPFSMIINKSKGYILSDQDKFDESIVQFKKTTELFPDAASVAYNFVDVYAAKGMYDNAVKQNLTALKLDGRDELAKDAEAEYKKSGWKGFLQKILESDLENMRSIQKNDKDAFFSSYTIAFDYAYLRNDDKTMQYLNKAYEDREPGLVYIKWNPTFDFLHDNQQFQELLKKINFPK